MYYFNSFLLYSILGFIMESTIYKFKLSKRHSGIFFGPVTAVYGIGALFLIILYNILYKKMKINKYLRVILYFILSIIFLTLIELIYGYIINILFNIDLWDYTKNKYNIGKYICLEVSIMWGFLALFFIYFIKPFFDKHIKNISKAESYIFSIVFLLDLCFTLIIKKH